MGKVGKKKQNCFVHRVSMASTGGSEQWGGDATMAVVAAAAAVEGGGTGGSNVLVTARMGNMEPYLVSYLCTRPPRLPTRDQPASDMYVCVCWLSDTTICVDDLCRAHVCT